MKSKPMIIASFVFMLLIGVVCGGVLLPAIQGTNTILEPEIEANVNVSVIRDGEVIYQESNHNTLMNIGAEYIETLMTNATYATTGEVKYISLSSNASAENAVNTQIAEEITTGGLARAAGTVSDEGNGNYAVEHEFTATATHNNVQLTGLNWKTGNTDNNLFAADQFTSVNLIADDKITVNWTITIS